MVSKYVRMGGVGTWKWGRVSVGHACWGVISKMGDDPKSDVAFLVNGGNKVGFWDYV